MIEQGRLAHHRRDGGYHNTRNEYPLDRTYIPHGWEEPQVGQGRVLGCMAAAVFACLVVLMGVMASRSPMYAAEHPEPAQVAND